MSAGRYIFRGAATAAEQDPMAARVPGQALSRRRMLAGAMTSVGAVALAACADSSSGGDASGATEDPADDAETLVVAHRDAHQLWNDRDLETFIPTFMPVIHYLEVASGHEISDPDEMIEFASKWFKAAPDAKLSGVYWFSGTSGDQLGDAPKAVHPEVAGDTWTVGMCTLTGTQTGPLPDGQAPTNKPFSLELAEFIAWPKDPPSSDSVAPPWKATGGAMYFNILSLAEQLGLDTPPDLPVGI